jgi:hypothetical protein
VDVTVLSIRYVGTTGDIKIGDTALAAFERR